MGSAGKGGLGLLVALGVCLPCLLPVLGIAVLSGVGTGAIGSFLSDNGLLVAIIAAGAAVCALTIGLIVRRALYGTTGIRFVEKRLTETGGGRKEETG